MNRFKTKLIDLLTYPISFYEKLSDHKVTFFIGIALVGVIDLLLPDVSGFLKGLFNGKSPEDIRFNAAMAVFVLLLLGFIDVVFMGMPLFDFFRYLKKKEINMNNALEGDENQSPTSVLLKVTEATGSIATPVKVMKVYIMSHFIITPVSVLIYYALTSGITDASPAWLQNLVLALYMLILIWSAAIIARGINVLYRFNPLFKRLTFLIVFTWNFIFGMVLSSQIMNWVLKLFR